MTEIDYRVGYNLTLLALEIKKTEEKTVKMRTVTFQWLTDLTVTFSNSARFAKIWRSRWYIENQIFNKQKNIRYSIQHADSLDYNAMKCHCLLTQISDIVMQLYEKGRPGYGKLHKNFDEPLTGEDISFMSANGYVKAA